MQELVPGWLCFLLGDDRAGFVVAVARDALALLIIVGLLIGTTWIISQAAAFFGDTVHLLPYINYVHEAIVALSIVALVSRTAVDMWNFGTKRRQ